jgi:hypothetical protein
MLALFVVGLTPVAAFPGDFLDKVLAYRWADGYFPAPDWYTIESSYPGDYSLSWLTDAEVVAVVTYRRQAPAEFFPSNEYSQVVDESWLEAVFGSYDQWEEVGRCTSPTYLLVEVEAQHQGTYYNALYWIWSEGEASLSVTAVYDRRNSDSLRAFAKRFFPSFTNCGSRG